MAHFAELDENNVVINVVVIDNKETHDPNGVESEELGIAYCKKIFGLNTKWKQTSYNASSRFRYAGVGMTYNEQLDAFISPKPYPSWTLNETTAEWDPPVPMPELTEQEKQGHSFYQWNEANQSWDLVAGNL